MSAPRKAAGTAATVAKPVDSTDPAARTRKGWDIGLSILFLVLAVVVGVMGAFFGLFAVAFIDYCPADTCNADAAVSAQFAAALVVILIGVVGLIATTIALVTRRRGWWIGLLTLVGILIAWFVGFLGYFAAVGWQ